MNFEYSNTRGYRKDIDGLRAIAVVAVIAFHFGFLPNGFLGVDVFFVISGYLITGIIYKELTDNKFSIVNFYLRRTRRILPLTLFVVFVALLTGMIVMLPDDLENLAQSVVATNLFGNNVLQAITTKNYWDVVNEFKPLMHTWSLGIEEQYYIAYPLLLLLIGKHHKKWLLPALTILGVTSLGLYFLPFKEFEKFYYLPFRFFELALGGIAALHLKDRVLIHKFSAIFVIGLVVVLFAGQEFLTNRFALPVAVILTLAIIVTHNEKNIVSSFILQNKLSLAIGLISFSLYMWHQVVLAYSRYFLFQRLKLAHIVLMSFVIISLSVFSYYTIERPFRNKNRVSTGMTLSVLGLLFIVTTLPSLYIYWKGGIIRDVPELGITKSDAVRNVHAKYNARVHSYDKSFSEDLNTKKVLVIGNSFGRDWVNVLLESKYSKLIEISYVYDPFENPEFQSRAKMADVIFYSTADRQVVDQLGIEKSKLFVVGTKNFGVNSGYFYNYSGDNYFQQRTLMEDGYINSNTKLRQEWGGKYVDLIAIIIDKNNTVPVFTDDHMFISQDCRHFTKAGAVYFANLLEDKLSKILAISRSAE